MRAVWANSEVREMDNKEQECCCLSWSSGSGDESVSSAIESDDRPHLSPEHCHLLPAVITRLLRRCSPQHLREGTSWRWPLHKFESCLRAWIHVDTLKITAKGQGRIVLQVKVNENAPLATLLQKGPKKKTGHWWRPSLRGLPEGHCKCHPLAGQFDLVPRVSFHVNGLVNSYLNWDWYWKKWKNINAVFFEIVLTSLTRKTSQGKRRPGLPRDRLRHSNGDRLEPELSQTSQNAAMRRCHPPFFLFHYPLV